MYYEDSHIKVYNKSCTDMSELEDNSIQCCVTSPPYWGLRKYDGNQGLIWGGDKNCQHEWTITPPRRSRKAGDIKNPDSKEATNGGNLGQELTPTNTCSICNAWKGQYGLEPTPELYVAHSIECLREIKRVLRPDGVVFFNLGDSYVSGGKNPNPSHQQQYVPEDGNSGKEFLNWQECGCACSCHDDERINLLKNHTSGNYQQLSTEPSQLYKIDRDKQHLDSASIAAACVPLFSQESNRHVSSLVSRENPFVRFCSGCLQFHYSAYHTSLSGTLYHIPKPKAKDLALIPFRVAIAAQEDGWYIRSVIIWNKPNPMPESVKDRPTDAYEHILMMTKSSRYYWDMEAVREENISPLISKRTIGFKGNHLLNNRDNRSTDVGLLNPNGRNLRNVWTFPTQPYPEAHFATFPEALPERCIKAATPEYGCCDKCGKPYERIVESNRYATRPGLNVKDGTDEHYGEDKKYRYMVDTQTLGWKQACKCENSKPIPSTVLDTFCGSGTTLWVAKKLGRKAIGYELSEKYCNLIVDRNRQQVIL